MGPLTPDNGGGAWGVGASGTADCCCWAKAAGLKIVPELRSAASAIAVKPSFTGISSSQTPQMQPLALSGQLSAFSQSQKPTLFAENGLQMHGLPAKIGQQGCTRQSIRRAAALLVALPAKKHSAYAYFGLENSS